MDLKQLIREIPDFPKPGINFYDITTLLKNPVGWHTTMDCVTAHYKDLHADIVVGIESRGFFFAPTLAYTLAAGFVPVRKPGKLPAATADVEYALEYGTDKLQIHKDAVAKGQRVLIFDDVLATGGTASAVARLVEQLGGVVVGLGFLIELTFLKGRDKLTRYEMWSLLQY